MTYRSTVLADSPVAYWPLDETVLGTGWYDLVANYRTGRTGTVVPNVTQLVPTDAGGCVVTPSASSLGPSDDALFNVGTGDFAIECWVLFPNDDGFYQAV